MCARRVTGISFFIYPKSQKIGKPYNLKVKENI